MTVDQAREARREGRRVEWWDGTRGGWRRGLVRNVARETYFVTLEGEITRKQKLLRKWRAKVRYYDQRKAAAVAKRASRNLETPDPAAEPKDPAGGATT